MSVELKERCDRIEESLKGFLDVMKTFKEIQKIINSENVIIGSDLKNK